MAVKTRRFTALVALLLIVGSGILAACGGLGAIRPPEGPGMLYFYAEW